MSDLVSARSPALNDRKILFLAVLLTAVGAALIFLLSKALLIHQDFIGSIYENGVPRALAGFFLILFPYIHQRLAGKRRSNFSYLPDEAVPFEAYTLPWYIVLAYGVLVTFALAGISLFLVWLIGLATGFFITRAISILNWIILLITLYYFGFWAGTRNAHRPFLIAVGIVLGYTILEFVVSVVLNTDSPLRGILGLVMFLILSLVTALSGARIGKRRRLSNYVHFLLTALPEQDRQTVVDDLYREVRQRIGIE
ncbi:MAG TPA: hypothetical protein VGK56_05420 [Anaerolineales bacterium]